MHRLGLIVAAAALGWLAVACNTGDGGETREVLVDYLHDEIAASFLLYFPGDVTVRPGDTVRFQQEWTGEPHSVTMGTLVDDVLREAMPVVEKYRGTPLDEVPPEDFQRVDELFGALPPYMLPEDLEGGPVNQNVGQPCYLDEGAPPEDPMTPCPDEEQQQPAFNGRQSFYNSGFIPYEGPQGNTFEVPLADDIDPGTYYYYCNVHGPLQYGTIQVVDADEEIPSQAEVAAQARREIEEVASLLLEAEEEALRQDEATVFGQTVRKPYAGWGVDDEWTHAFVDEFYPQEIRTSVGETVTWTFIGPHTVSFNVPDYFAQLTVEDDGTVIFSPDALQPRGGPGYPAPPGEGGPGEGPGGEQDGDGSQDEGDGPGESGTPPEVPEGDEPPAGEPPADLPPPPEPPEVEVGEWDGEGFLSSGMFFDGTYSVTFTEPGSYRYACLVHPHMVGTVVVEEEAA